MPIFLPPTITAGEVSWATSFSQTLADSSQIGLENYSFRQAIAASAISTSGTTIRVTISANAGATSTFDNISIVERSGSTENGTTTPTELKFSGASGVSISAGGTAVSDALSFTLDETKSYLVIFDFAASGGNAQRHSSAGDTTYFKAATNSWNVQSPAGFSSAATQTWSVSKIEVL